MTALTRHIIVLEAAEAMSDIALQVGCLQQLLDQGSEDPSKIDVSKRRERNKATEAEIDAEMTKLKGELEAHKQARNAAASKEEEQDGQNSSYG
ncbi:hypothetical protein C2857_000530 [Epichloe festucae Fl1]|uniref:Uncharacterized protein n=1 Tax=Epichloe festucae (strain Fl1) TaxID=877507 RepID=A0A7S9KV85_EPIFF|nr:hypothetical protein C2857_000530 [Epichloe festucae Fl1]